MELNSVEIPRLSLDSLLTHGNHQDHVWHRGVSDKGGLTKLILNLCSGHNSSAQCLMKVWAGCFDQLPDISIDDEDSGFAIRCFGFNSTE